MRFHIDDLAVFVRIAELGTLSAVARERNVPVSQITRALARLEADCGIRLVHRTTHGLSLTDEGDTVLEYGRGLLETTDELAGELTGKLEGPSGWVRVGVGASVAQAVIAPSLPALYARHPGLHIDLIVDDRVADMARDGIDIAIRTDRVQSDSLVARQLGSGSRTLYASPAYLKSRGTPSTPEDLGRHHLIANSRVSRFNEWQRADSKEVFRATGQSRADNSAMLLTLTLAGVGISRILDLVARPYVAAGQLVPLLRPHFDQGEVPIFAVMLQERHRLPKIRACVDFWGEVLSTSDKYEPAS